MNFSFSFKAEVKRKQMRFKASFTFHYYVAFFLL